MDAKQEDFPECFRGVVQLYGREAFQRFQRARVMVVGLGGVGSWVVEGLARSGVGHLDLCDLDDVCVNNINRQIQALPETVGQSKVRALAARVRATAPDCRVRVIEDFFTLESVGLLDELTSHGEPVLVVDAIDSLNNKALLVDACLQRSLTVLCAGSAGGRRQAGALRTHRLSEATIDPLLRSLRRVLRKDFGRDTTAMPSVFAAYSTEITEFRDRPKGCESAAPAHPVRVARSCDTGLGTSVHVTATMGFHLVGCVLELLEMGSGKGPGLSGAP